MRVSDHGIFEEFMLGIGPELTAVLLQDGGSAKVGSVQHGACAGCREVRPRRIRGSESRSDVSMGNRVSVVIHNGVGAHERLAGEDRRRKKTPVIASLY